MLDVRAAARGQQEQTRPGHPASIPRTSSSYINAEGVVRPSLPRLPWMDRAPSPGYAGVYSPVPVPAERAWERCGVPAAALHRDGQIGYTLSSRGAQRP